MKTSALKTIFKFILVTIIYFAHIYFRRLPITLLPLIRQEITLNSDNIGLLVSAHAFCYTIGRFLFGVASDKYSKVALLLIGLITCATCSVGLGFATEFWHLLVALLFLGIVQGAGWVPATLLVQTWYSKGTYGTMFSILACGSTFAGILQPVSKRFNWRQVEIYTGAGMLLFSVVCYFALREDNKSPKTLENEPDTAKANAKSQSGLRLIVGSIVIWHIAFVYLFTMEMRTICETWVQLFLTDVQISPDAFQITYEIGGLVGTMASGIIIDLATSKFDVDATRRVIAVSYTCLMMICAAGIFQFPELSSVFGFLSGMFVNGSINVWCMVASQAGHKHIQGTVSAFISFVASSGSMLAGTPLAYLISSFGYGVFLYIFSVQLIIVIVVSLFRVRLRMQSELTPVEESSKSESDNDIVITVVDSKQNLTTLKKEHRFSMRFVLYASNKIRPIKHFVGINKI
ncbi:unnamed protein product [Caenorhabditis bovis]|uniref:Major facilitator superfamily (MFS) profile domain-containing protein n=1 Tax=Caenorhabditis bovis TaxID=2654633 RepID=A0A8S1E8R4_9PELO|nr:unnamed protein product [Caenorhabditis bovis]